MQNILYLEALRNRPPRKGNLDRKLRVGYVRSDAIDSQPLAEQIAKMKGCDRVFSDKPVKHGTTFSRPEFKKMYNFLRKGDTLVITRLDRLAGSLEDLLSALWDFCCGLEVELVVLDEGIDTLSQDCGPMFRALDAIGSALEVWCEEELALERES